VCELEEKPNPEGQLKMFQAFLLRCAFPLTTALLGGFGVFCAIYSFTEAQVAAQA
jgi:hypothetical protein